MLLPDHEIGAAIDSGRLGIDPYDPSLVQPASLDIRLGEEFYARMYQAPMLVLDDSRARLMPPVGRFENATHRGPLDLRPGQFVLAHTLETIGLPDDLAGRVEGKSSLGRLGLLIHTTAGFIDPGFTGQVTLELANLSQEIIPLVPGQPIGQLCLIRLTSPAAVPYGADGLGSHYQGQRGATPSRFTPPPLETSA